LLLFRGLFSHDTIPIWGGKDTTKNSNSQIFCNKNAFFSQFMQLFYAKSSHNWNKEGNFAVHNTKKAASHKPAAS